MCQVMLSETVCQVMLSVQVLMFLGIKKYIKIVQRRDSYVVIFNLIITLLSEGKYLSLSSRGLILK